MIELPEWVVPNGVTPALIDKGISMPGLRVDRPGNRFRAEVSLPPMRADRARIVISRLLRAKRQGLRIDYPLLDVPQGSPGSPVMDGAGQTGTTIALRGLTPNYTVKEGYWLTLIDAAGKRFLHNAAGVAVADASGDVEIEIEPAVRGVFADGATVLLGKPEIEGLVVSEVSWPLPTDKLVRLAFVIEEME